MYHVHITNVACSQNYTPSHAKNKQKKCTFAIFHSSQQYAMWPSPLLADNSFSESEHVI